MDPLTIDAGIRGLLGLLVAGLIALLARARFRNRTGDDAADPGLD